MIPTVPPALKGTVVSNMINLFDGQTWNQTRMSYV